MLLPEQTLDCGHLYRLTQSPLRPYWSVLFPCEEVASKDGSFMALNMINHLKGTPRAKADSSLLSLASFLKDPMDVFFPSIHVDLGGRGRFLRGTVLRTVCVLAQLTTSGELELGAPAQRAASHYSVLVTVYYKVLIHRTRAL